MTTELDPTTIRDGSLERPLLLPIENIPHDLDRWCRLANACALQIYETHDTCIATSHALAAFLAERGLPANPERITVYVTRQHPKGWWTGVVLGSQGDGSRQPPTKPGYWKGHLGVRCGQWLLDPTVDVVNGMVPEGTEPAGLSGLEPTVIELPRDWDEGRPVYLITPNCTHLEYHRYPRQIGWKSCGNARPIAWRPILEAMVTVANRNHWIRPQLAEAA
jgi:hypothetical protein